jgi:predicted MarR family transcription regulator
VLEWLPSALSRAQQRASELQVYWNASCAEPASEAELADCERAVSHSLSSEHRAFLKISNGAILSTAFPDRPWATFGVRIYSTREIVEDSNNIAKEIGSSATVPTQLVAFCNYDDGDRCLADYSRVRNGEPVIIDAFHETPGEWENSEPIADSFESWLKRMLDTFIVHGRPLWYWLPDAN